MATAASWSSDHPLAQRILNRARYFEYFQLIHLLERTACNQAPVGRQGPVPKELVRIRPVLSLGFPPGDIAAADWDDGIGAGGGDGRLLLTTTFLGLYGSDSPLPAHFTERLLPEQEEDELVRDFLDQFHHRVYSLLYRCWAKFRYYVTFRPDGADSISMVVRALLGIGTTGTFESLDVPPLRYFRYVGLYSQRPRSTAGLIGLLRDFFEGVDVDVEQCVGRWLPIEDDDRNVMGRANCMLGQNFLLGERLYDRAGRFRVKLGPLIFDQYTQFLPPGKSAVELAELVRFYTGDPLEFDLQLTLKGEEVPDLPLGERGMLGRLSWTTWLKSKPAERTEVIFPPGHERRRPVAPEPPPPRREEPKRAAAPPPVEAATADTGGFF